MGWSSMWKWWLLTWSKQRLQKLGENHFGSWISDSRPSQTASIPSIRYTQRFNENRIATFYDHPGWCPFAPHPGCPRWFALHGGQGDFWRVLAGPWNASPMFFGACHENNAISWHFPWTPLFGTQNRLPKIWHFIISCMEFGPFPSPEILVD